MAWVTLNTEASVDTGAAKKGMSAMGMLQGKVAFITGAARGQGRSHAVCLAREGADIIAVDLCAQVRSVHYQMATPEELAETVREVEALGRRIVARTADVRESAALEQAVEEGLSTLGRVDIVVANAGINAISAQEDTDPLSAFQDSIAINLFGVRNTVHAAVPAMVRQGEGGAIVLTGSTQALSGRGGMGTGGWDGYVAAKHGVVGLMRSYANWLAPHNIRVNSVHPTAVNTPMIMNEVAEEMLASVPGFGDAMTNLMPVPVIEAVDVSNAVLYLVGDSGRYVTGAALPVDAGFLVK